MPGTDLTISSEQRDALYELVVNHVSGLDAVWIAMQKGDYASAERKEELARRSDVGELQPGVSVLAAGQLSEREFVENGVAVRRSVIVASLAKAGPPPESWKVP